MIFYKYHSTGNDFLLIKGPIDRPSDIAKYVCDRHFGIGADGMLVALPSDREDVRMAYYNQDGSEAPMCGNGLRAFTHFVYHQGLVAKTAFIVETKAGSLPVQIEDDHDVSIHLNQPIWTLEPPHILKKHAKLEAVSIAYQDTTYDVYPLFLGTLHGIVFTQALSEAFVLDVGSYLCHHQHFPEQININFVNIIDDTQIEVATYERGVGPTLSCGTGVSASVALTHAKGLISHQVAVSVPGGMLHVTIKEDDVILRGPTKMVAKVQFTEDLYEDI